MYNSSCIIDKKTGKDTCPLQSVHVESNIDNDMAEVLIKQHFKNTGFGNIEAVYIFPLPHKAKVTELIARIGEAEIVGEIKEKEIAYQEYDAAVRKGDSAFLLDSHRPDIFQIWLGNIAAGEDVTIEITYTEEIAIIDQELRWVLPSVVAPRYIPGSMAGNDVKPNNRSGMETGEKTGFGTAYPTDRVHDADQITPPVGYAPYTLSVNVSLYGLKSVKKVSSPSHPIEVESIDEAYLIKLARENEPLDSDFVLIANIEHQNENSFITASDSSEESFGYARFYIDIENHKEADKNFEYYFVIDVSGSMNGEKLSQAKRAIHISLRNLMEGDSFNLIAFQSQYSCFSKESLPYSQKNLDKADSWIDSLAAGGGTEILEPLKYVLKDNKEKDEREKIVLLFTDGQVGNEREIHDFVQTHNQNLSFFPFGIDTAVNKYFIDGLADAGNGIPEYVYPGERIEDKVIRQFSRIHQPYIANAMVLDSKYQEIDVLPPLPKRLYDSESYSFIFRTEGSGKMDGLIIQGDLLYSRKAIVIEASGRGNAGLMSYKWAKEKIRELEGQLYKGNARRDKAIQSDIIQLSIKYGVLSTLTSFVAVYQRGIKVKGIPQTLVIPVDMPKMWGMARAGSPAMDWMECEMSRGAAPAPMLEGRARESEETIYRSVDMVGSAPKKARSINPFTFLKGKRETADDSKNALNISDLIRLTAEKQNADGTYGSRDEIIPYTSYFIIGMLLTKDDWKPYRIQITKAVKALINGKTGRSVIENLLKSVALYLALKRKLLKEDEMSMSPCELSNHLPSEESKIFEAVIVEDFVPLSKHLQFDFDVSTGGEGKTGLAEFLLLKLYK